jgi:hypothetical protein
MEPFFQMFAFSTFCGGPITILFFLFQYSFLFYRRGVYGEKHSRASVQAFFVGVFGLIAPFFLIFVMISFVEIIDKIYIVVPLLIHLVPVSLMFGAYLFAKDIGGRFKTGLGFTIFGIASMFGAMLESITIFEPENISEDAMTFILVVSLLLAIVAIAGLIVMIVGMVDVNKWTNENRPLIDTQQKLTLEMQQNQIRMQQKQLELQYQQLELQKAQMEMLTEMKQESIGAGKEMIPETIKEDDNERKPWE